MRRGIIFSIDSMLAMLLLVIMAGLYAGMAVSDDAQLHVAELKGNEAGDDVANGHYSGNVSGSAAIGGNAECIDWHDYVISGGSGQSTPQKKTVCEGFQ